MVIQESVGIQYIAKIRNPKHVYNTQTYQTYDRSRYESRDTMRFKTLCSMTAIKLFSPSRSLFVSRSFFPFISLAPSFSNTPHRTSFLLYRTRTDVGNTARRGGGIGIRIRSRTRTVHTVNLYKNPSLSHFKLFNVLRLTALFGLPTLTVLPM